MAKTLEQIREYVKAENAARNRIEQSTNYTPLYWNTTTRKIEVKRKDGEMYMSFKNWQEAVRELLG